MIFFMRKSLKVSFYEVVCIIYAWYVVRYRNETFLILLQEVSLKSHESLIKVSLKSHESFMKVS